MTTFNLLSGNSLQTGIASLLYVNKHGLIEDGSIENKEAKTKKHDQEASIRYSRTIQNSIMPGGKNLSKYFPESFLIDLPKDVVSGDFFWIKKVGNKTVIIVGDCAGHGVPAALLSVLGITLLNQIVIEEEITDPSIILQKLSAGIKKTFYNPLAGGNMNPESMDLAVCCIDHESETIYFEGALRPAYIIRDKKLTIIKGSRHSITGDNSHKYFTKEYQFKKGDILYLFTDGFADQFGGHKNKKLLIKRFQEALVCVSDNTMGRQMQLLKEVFIDWKAGMEQTDDIILAGIKL